MNALLAYLSDAISRAAVLGCGAWAVESAITDAIRRADRKLAARRT